MTNHLVIGYHGHCFDGMASAALLTRLLQDTRGAFANISYRGLEHQPGGSFVPEEALSGDTNAVVDFRYSTSPKLHWWFDHHITGIVGSEEQAHYESHDQSQKFFDPQYGSCAKLIADVGRSRFGWHVAELDDLVYWAHLIDTASFPDAKTAVELKQPALQLMTVIEAHGTDDFLAPRIRRLAAGEKIATLAAEPEVQSLFQPLQRAHQASYDAIRAAASERGGVVLFDISQSGTERYNKFIPYWLFPEARYCVAVTAGKERSKVSVGFNPWSSSPRSHNISQLCAAYGGGGHPVVGAVSLGPNEVERARQIAREIAAQLRS